MHKIVHVSDEPEALTLIEQAYGGRVGRVIELSWPHPQPQRLPDELELARSALASQQPAEAIAHALIALVERLDRMELGGSPIVDRTPPDNPEAQAQRLAWLARGQAS